MITKFFMTTLMALMVMGAGNFVYAADEFGSRFGDQSPTALKEEASGEEVNPQDIEPAAGSETDDTDNSAPGNAPAEPADDQASAQEDAPAEGETKTPE